MDGHGSFDYIFMVKIMITMNMIYKTMAWRAAVTFSREVVKIESDRMVSSYVAMLLKFP